MAAAGVRPIRRLALLLLAACALGSALRAEEPEYRVVVTAGPGYSRLVSTAKAAGLNKNGFAGLIRLMWAPEHLLSVGIEGGYHTLYVFRNEVGSPEVGASGVKVVQSSLPLYLSFAMHVTDFLDLVVGTGGTFITTHIDGFGSRNEGTQWSTSNMAGVSCLWPVSARLRVGGEIHYHAVHKMKNGNLVLQAVIAFDLLRY